MKILAIDDELPALNMLTETIEELKPDSEIVSFSRSIDFFNYGHKDSFDAAFIDISLDGVSGIQLAIELKKYSPQCNIIFVTAYSSYAMSALKVRPSGYVLKPYTIDDIAAEFNNLRYDNDQLYANGGRNKLRVRTFGSFAAFDADNNCIRFSRTISKEIFAYLIDQCCYPVTSRDIAADVLEEDYFDRTISKKVSQYIADLIKDLELAGYQNVIIKQNRQIQINKDEVDCDLYNLLDGDTSVLNDYHGEYMIDYSWAEISDAFDRIRVISEDK